MAGPYPPDFNDPYARAALDTERQFGPSASTGGGALSQAASSPGMVIDIPRAGPPSGAGTRGPSPQPPQGGPAPNMPPQALPPVAGPPLPTAPPIPAGGPQMPAGPLPAQGGPGTPPPGAGPAPSPKQPSNDGLINRVLGLLNGDQQRQQQGMMQQMLQQGMKMGAQSVSGRVPGAPAPSPMGGADAHIQQLLDYARMVRGGGGGRAQGSFVVPGGGHPAPYPGMAPPQQPGMSHGGMLRMMRGGYPLNYLEGHPGLPTRSYARGSYVRGDGRGNGRSDHIDAKLSPKEFVMDAETMSMLGDGDPDAGAEEMESLRQNIRKHKGRALAKGKFSPNAKSPEAYMSKDPYSLRRHH